MPIIDDYSEEDDEDRGPAGGGSSHGGGGGAVAQAQPSPQHESEFVPWERFRSANQEVSQRGANNLSSSIQGQVDRTRATLDSASQQHQQDITSNYRPAGIMGIEKPDEPAQTAAPAAPAAGGSFGVGGAAAALEPPPPAAQPASTGPKAASSPQPQASTVPTAQASPWSMLNGQVAAPPAAAPAVADNRMEFDPDRLATDPLGRTYAQGLTGAKSLEDQLGANAWDAFLKDALHAGDSAQKLGTDSGLQELIEKGGQSPGSVFDAALIGEAGDKEFRDLSSKYGKGQLLKNIGTENQASIDRWKQLQGDAGAAASARDQQIREATEAYQRDVAGRAKADADATAARGKIQETITYLQSKWPTFPFAQSQESMLAWMNANAKGAGPSVGVQQSWANSIYGPNTGYGPEALVTKLYQDIKKMTPEEYALFAQGFVPPWMGLGAAAMGANGGFWWGLRNSNNFVSGETTNDASGLSPEERADYEEKMRALSIFYDVLAAAMAAFGPWGVAAGAAGRGIQKSQTGV